MDGFVLFYLADKGYIRREFIELALFKAFVVPQFCFSIQIF